jgi:hypothetical protein
MKSLIAISLRNVSTFTSQAAEHVERIDTKKVGEFVGSVKKNVEFELDKGLQEFKAQLPKKEVNLSKSIGKGMGLLFKSGIKAVDSISHKTNNTIKEFKEGYQTA